ncbi:MAG: IPT/TIG domain-containing protein [Thermoplasmata archaeon]|nr:IPT/TIG domain-containing protein [Thermoplasmata archaeon]
MERKGWEAGLGGQAWATTDQHSVSACRRWQPSRGKGGPLTWGPVQVALSILIVLILVDTSSTFSNHSGRSSAKTQNGPSPFANASTVYYPYVIPPSQFPYPDALVNESGNVSLPQVATTVVNEVDVYLVAFVLNETANGTILALQSGSYNASLAQTIFPGTSGGTSTCFTWCSTGTHLPIVWSPPVMIAAYGSQQVQGDALAVYGTQVVVAAASGNYTSVYFSPTLGSSGSWMSATGNIPVAGNSPKISSAGCSAVLTTLTANSLIATHLPLDCGIPMPAVWNDIGPVHGRGPGVSGVLPYEAGVGSSVLLNGTNLQYVTNVYFGGVPASFSLLREGLPPTIWAIQATVPQGSGLVGIRVYGNNTWSQLNCSNQFLYGAALPINDPQVYNITPSPAYAGQGVTIRGEHFTTSPTVLFGSTQVSSTRLSPNLLTTLVPSGAGNGGSVNVEVTTSFGNSPQTCGDRFSYYGAGVTSLSSNDIWHGMTLTIYGFNFSQSATVYFGTLPYQQPATMTWISSSILQVTVPANTNWVNTQVPVEVDQPSSQGTVKSNVVTPTYEPPGPLVTGLNVPVSPSGTQITLTGFGFDSSATAYFGSSPASGTTYVSASTLYATAPSGTGVVNVTVSQTAGTSPVLCGDQFDYGPAPVGGSPVISCIANPSGPSGSSVAIFGSNLNSGPGSSYVFFGGVPAQGIAYASGSLVVVGAALGNGTVPVQVVTTGGTSAILPMSNYSLTFPWPLEMPMGRFTWNLPPAISADPAGNEILAANSSNPNIVLYNYLSGTGYGASTLAPFNTTLGSAIFNQVGGTYLFAANGTPGQVAFVDEGGLLFGAFTTNSGGRTVLETVSSVNWGLNWSGPYLVGSAVGSVSDPEVVGSPAGYTYLTWRETGGGPAWQVDQAVFGQSGRLALAPGTFPGSGGATGLSAGPPTVAVDGFNRPIYAWQTSGGGLGARIEYTGAFPTPSNELRLISQGFNNTTAPDFLNFGASSLMAFRQQVNNQMAWLRANISGPNLCHSQRNALNALYTTITTLEPSPMQWDNTSNNCQLSHSIDQSLLANTSGPLTPNEYLGIETEVLLEALGVGVFPDPNAWAQLLSGLPNNSGGTGLFTPGQGVLNHDALGDSVSIQPLTINPYDVWLNSSGKFLSYGELVGSSTYQEIPSEYWTNITLQDSGPHSMSFASWSSIPSLFLMNLTTQSGGTWSGSVTATYNRTAFVTTLGKSSTLPNPTYPSGWPTKVTFPVSGTWTTGLSPYPWSLALNSTQEKYNRVLDALHWTNTMEAIGSAWINYTSNNSNAASWSNATYGISENISGSQAFQPILGGKQYQLTVQLQSESAAGAGQYWNNSWRNQINAMQMRTTYPQTVSFSCDLQQAQSPPQVCWPRAGIATNITATSATMTCYRGSSTGSAASAWVTYNDTFGLESTETAQIISLNNGSTEYVAQLHGLAPWGMFNVSGSMRFDSGCTPVTGLPMKVSLVSQNVTPTFWFQTAAVAPITEQDYPYDSVTKQGG